MVVALECHYIEILLIAVQEMTMLNNSSSFMDSRVLISVRAVPGRSAISRGADMQMPSRWPFTVENAMKALPADSSPAARQEMGNFIT